MNFCLSGQRCPNHITIAGAQSQRRTVEQPGIDRCEIVRVLNVQAGLFQDRPDPGVGFFSPVEAVSPKKYSVSHLILHYW